MFQVDVRVAFNKIVLRLFRVMHTLGKDRILFFHSIEWLPIHPGLYHADLRFVDLFDQGDISPEYIALDVHSRRNIDLAHFPDLGFVVLQSIGQCIKLSLDFVADKIC